MRAEREFSVPALALPDTKRLPDLLSLSQYEAVALFIERAQAIKPEFQVTNTNAPAVAEICVRLDGLPLAIELAAARIGLFPPQALLTRLEQRLPLLTSSTRDVPARQQTLRGTIKWSYDLLTSEEQCIFRHLSIFVGGCTLEAVESVSASLGDTLPSVVDRVASLLDKNLLLQTAREEEEPRLTMLETIREFGLEVLTNAGEADMTRQTHAHFYLALAELAKPELSGPNQEAWVQRLEQEHNNLRAALEWALGNVADKQARERMEVALRLSFALKAFWDIHGYYSEARIFLERALASSEGTSASLRARVLGATAYFAVCSGDFDRAEVLAQHSLSLFHELGDTRGIADSLFLLGDVAGVRGKTAEAITFSEEGMKLMRQVGEPGEVAESLFSLADQVCGHGDYGRGQALFEEALTFFHKAGNERMVGATLIQSALRLWLSASSDAGTIRQRLQQGQALAVKVGDRYLSAHYASVAAWVALMDGEHARASQLAQESIALLKEIDSKWEIAMTIQILGRVEAQRGDLSAARKHFIESLTLSREMGEKPITPFILEGLAGVAAAESAFSWAAQLWGAAEALREEIATPLMPVFRTDYEHAVATACQALGEEAFAAAWAEGRSMTLDQVLGEQGIAAISTPASTEQPAIPITKSSPPYPDGLTAREVEVLCSVAKGLTDAQIAEQLVISPRTVNTHLTSIYSKIQVSSRSAATRYAIEHHLV